MQRSHRLTQLPLYAVGELAARKRRLVSEGVDVIDVSAGDADFPPPEIAVEALREAVKDPAHSRYAFQVGLLEFREAIAAYMERRFGVTLDPMTEILPLLGCKEGLAHLGQAVLNPGDVCVLPDPGYPAYVGGAVLSGAEIETVALERDREFLVELADLPAERSKRVRLVYLNYPNNPTAAVAPRAYLERIVAHCRERDIVMAYDNPYVEITYGGYRAPSILEIDGARETAVEFHSLSKTFSMTGWRLGWAAGAAPLIEALRQIKNYVDTGPFLGIQRAGAAVLAHTEQLAADLVARFERRRDAAVAAFASVGLAAPPPQATMYLWLPVPSGWRSEPFATAMLEREGVMLLPGTAFGRGGEGYVRVALTSSETRLTEAAARVGRGLEAEPARV